MSIHQRKDGRWIVAYRQPVDNRAFLGYSEKSLGGASTPPRWKPTLH
jgi:hypothetical protein